MQTARVKLEVVYLGRAYKFLKEFKEEEGFPFLESLYKADRVDEFIQNQAEDLVEIFLIKEELPVDEEE
jgi:hypothetical protein